ncbi:MAG: hypothetical protein KF832_08995 [Caldilineaceae bacterium]|nr:hypothetical protein [Caldilineaceae bacterium]
MATISFVVSPATVKRGEAATLRWDIEGVREIYLDGQGVTGHESRTITPGVTTTYTLRILLVDGATEFRRVTVVVDHDLVPSHRVTRPPTVVLSPANVAQLRQYPRPPQDNGRGLHFHLNLSAAVIAKSVERLQSIKAAWTMIYAPDELQAERTALACWGAGIMPVIRIGKLVDDFFNPVPYVQKLRQAGIPPYVQIYNEPGDSREWTRGKWPRRPPANYVQIFANNWAQQAAAVYDAGGYPGLQVMGKSELDAAIDAVAARGRTDIWQRAFFVQHNYGVNHPPAFPYDALNQQEHPGQTVMENPVAALAGIAFAHWMQARLGFVLPIIGGEGGWQHGVFNDPRYPKVEQPYHAQYHQEIFEWFRTGTLSNGEPLPDYLFSVTPWILGGWHTSEDWWDGPLGTHTETIAAVRAIPAFVRRFSWDEETPVVTEPVVTQPVEPVAPEPVVPEPVVPEPVAPDNGGAVVAIPLVWDGRLDALGVRLVRSSATSAWRVVKAIYRDPTESGNRHHVDILALRANGAPAQGVRLTIDWVGRQPHEKPGFLITDQNGRGNYPIYNNFHPEKKDGTNFVALADEPGDRVEGMGLPYKHHVCYEFIYQFCP